MFTESTEKYKMKYSIITSLIYIIVACNTSYFLGKNLYTNGEHFLDSIFIYKPEIVRPLNKMLLAGFYLVNLGFVLLFTTQHIEIVNLIESIEYLSEKLGTVYFVLGVMHLFNILTFIIIERKLYKSNF